MDIDQLVSGIYVSESRATASELSQPVYTSQDISLEFIRAITAGADNSGTAHTSIVPSESDVKLLFTPHKDAPLRSSSPGVAYQFRSASNFQAERGTSPVGSLDEDLNKLFADIDPIDRPSRPYSARIRDSEEGTRRDSSFAGVRSLRSGELPAKQLLLSSQAGRSNSLARTPAGSMLRSRRSTEQFIHVQSAPSEHFPQQDIARLNDLNASSMYSTFSGKSRPMTETEIVQRVFHVLNCLKLNNPARFFIHRTASQSILAFSEADTHPLATNPESHMPSPSQAAIVLKVDFPDQLRMCTYNMVYFGFYSLFDGLLEDDQGFLVTDDNYLTVSEVEPFCIAMARHVLDLVQSYNKYVSPSVAIEKLRTSSSITVPFAKCISVFRTELKTRRLTTIPRQDSSMSQYQVSSSVSKLTATLKTSDEVLNHCNMLHSLHEKKKIKQLEVDRKRAEDETAGCTFRPELNSRSVELSMRKRIMSGTSSVQESIESDIENYTVKARSLNELDDYTKIISNYLYELKMYAMNQRILAHFPDDHVIWDDAYHALRANNSLKYREDVMEEFRERMSAEVRHKDSYKPHKTKFKMHYKPHESILDAAVHPSVCYYNTHVKNVKDEQPYKLDERRRRNTALFKQGVLRPEFAGMTDQTFKDLPVASKMHTVIADRQAEYQERAAKADQRVAAVKPYVRGGGDITSLIGETGMGEVVQTTLNTNVGAIDNLDNDPLVSSPVLLSSLTRCLDVIKALTQQEESGPL